ncbi:hypothetical protein IV203_024037 [Nitzschia inconspicua]|uniref:Uncharacterized protein n=1 Tax=Nitzschia inconspicua TaxID=303405 RepID=A0A9K3KBX9_9STRA|nr:hypothetical protein IV203_024037 [Nitzschia inconspicua]
MSRWQNEDASSSSSSSSHDGSKQESEGEEEEEEADPYVTQRSRRSSSGNNKNKRSTEESRNNDDNKEDVIPTGIIPYRWIQDRTQGCVHGTDGLLAPRPPCFLCWPPPLLLTCPSLLESNCFCTTVGRIGFCNGSTSSNRRDYYSGFGNRGRCAIMTYALVFNLAGLLLTIFAALALTGGNENLLRVAAFSKTSLKPVVLVATLQQTIAPTTLYLGLQALSINNDVVVAYDDFCTTPGMEQFLPMEECNTCNDTTLYVMIGMLVTIVAYAPTLAIDCLRIYNDYDVNCQKIVSLVWCPDKFVFFVGFGMKAVDLLCNLCVATPTITRNREEQWTYERLSEEAETGNVTSGNNQDAADDNSSSS